MKKYRKSPSVRGPLSLTLLRDGAWVPMTIDNDQTVEGDDLDGWVDAGVLVEVVEEPKKLPVEAVKSKENLVVKPPASTQPISGTTLSRNVAPMVPAGPREAKLLTGEEARKATELAQVEPPRSSATVAPKYMPVMMPKIGHAPVPPQPQAPVLPVEVPPAPPPTPEPAPSPKVEPKKEEKVLTRAEIDAMTKVDLLKLAEKHKVLVSSRDKVSAIKKAICKQLKIA